MISANSLPKQENVKREEAAAGQNFYFGLILFEGAILLYRSLCLLAYAFGLLSFKYLLSNKCG